MADNCRIPVQWASLVCLALANASCTSLLGDFSLEPSASRDATTDASEDPLPLVDADASESDGPPVDARDAMPDADAEAGPSGTPPPLVCAVRPNTARTLVDSVLLLRPPVLTMKDTGSAWLSYVRADQTRTVSSTSVQVSFNPSNALAIPQTQTMPGNELFIPMETVAYEGTNHKKAVLYAVGKPSGDRFTSFQLHLKDPDGGGQVRLPPTTSISMVSSAHALALSVGPIEKTEFAFSASLVNGGSRGMWFGRASGTGSPVVNTSGMQNVSEFLASGALVFGTVPYGIERGSLPTNRQAWLYEPSASGPLGEGTGGSTVLHVADTPTKFDQVLASASYHSTFFLRHGGALGDEYGQLLVGTWTPQNVSGYTVGDPQRATSSTAFRAPDELPQASLGGLWLRRGLDATPEYVVYGLSNLSDGCVNFVWGSTTGEILARHTGAATGRPYGPCLTPVGRNVSYVTMDSPAEVLSAASGHLFVAAFVRPSSSDAGTQLVNVDVAVIECKARD